MIADDRNIADFDAHLLRKLSFTPAQLETFELNRQPFKFPRGGVNAHGVSPGFPVTNVSSWTGFLVGQSPPPWPSTAVQSPNELLAKGAPYSHITADTKTRAAYPGLDFTNISRHAELVQVAARS
jgi:hypothetical protein